MRHTLRNFWLLGLCLFLSIFVVKSVVSAIEPLKIDPNYPQTVWYRSALHTLNLWTLWWTTATLRQDSWKLKFTDWLVVWKDSNVGNSTDVVIWWWEWNKILNNVQYAYAWIWWWKLNEVNGKWAVIGWWEWNKANWANAVVVGWQSNTAEAQSVVVWWQWNRALNWGVVLGWSSNTGYKNSLALWSGSTSNEGSFAWRASAWSQSAFINASNWTLIGTTAAIDWVNLVVQGSVKVEWETSESAVKWEIRYVGGCFYWYDGEKWHVMNRWNDKNNNSECSAFPDTTAKFCYFGNTILWNGDTATAYTQPYGTGSRCNNNYRRTVTCNGVQDSLLGYYPYCYTIQEN